MIVTLPTEEKCREVCRALVNDPRLTPVGLEIVRGRQDQIHWSEFEKMIIAVLIEDFEV